MVGSTTRASWAFGGGGYIVGGATTIGGGSRPLQGVLGRPREREEPFQFRAERPPAVGAEA